MFKAARSICSLYLMVSLALAARPMAAAAQTPSADDLLRSGKCWQRYYGGKKVDYSAERGFELAAAKLEVSLRGADWQLRSLTDPKMTWRQVPCPEPAGSAGWYLGPEASIALMFLFDREFPAGSNIPSFESSDRNAGGGGGVTVGVNMPVSGINMVAGAFASFDGMDATVEHKFANGSTLGSTGKFMAEAGAKVGPTFAGGTWVYAIVAGGALDESVHVNFLPVLSSTSTVVGGVGAGAGVSVQPTGLLAFGAPVSIFAEFQHFWWQDAHFNMPASSPAFNYTFRREDNLIKIGLTVPLGVSAAPTAVAAPDYPVKALPPK
jgi:hypothetical protein